MSTSTPYILSTKNVSAPGTGGSDATWAFAQRINTDITTNLNNLTQTEVPIDGALINNQPGFAINGNGIELIGQENYVKCTAIIHITAAFNRANLILRFARNGVLFGPVGASGYIRNATGHNESSIHITTWTKMATNDVITIETLREAGAGTVTMASAGTSQLLLEMLVNV